MTVKKNNGMRTNKNKECIN